MNGRCFEIGAIQAFLDGETSPDVSLQISNHVAECDGCAFTLAAAEEETSAVFSVLDREMNTLVPTQRLWSRINETLAEEKGHTSVWRRLMSLASIYLENPSFAVAAGLMIVLGMFVAVWSPRVSDISGNIGNGPASSAPAPSGMSEQPEQAGPVTSAASTIGPSADENLKPPIRVNETRYPAEKLSALVRNASLNTGGTRVRPQNMRYVMPASAAPEYLPGEESYVTTIVGLRENIENEKDTILTPSSRVAYERDMAIVDDSIRRMREAVRRNPRNQSAKQVLYSSYQDKIDLLNSVAQREDLIASLK